MRTRNTHRSVRRHVPVEGYCVIVVISCGEEEKVRTRNTHRSFWRHVSVEGYRGYKLGEEK